MKKITATDARKQWFDLIEQAGKPGSFISIKHRDLPDVILMSSDEFDGWTETMEIMANTHLTKDIQVGLKEISSGKTTSLQSLKKKFAA